MDEDLAFCLGNFIDEQVKVIDDRLKELQEEENKECRRLEQEQSDANSRKPRPKNKGSHHEDQTLVDQFIQDLREDENMVNNKKPIIDDPVCIATLNAEISTKINATANYLNRIRNLARTQSRTTDFVESCNQSIASFRRAQVNENNFQELCSSLAESDADTFAHNTQQWWKEKYGNAVGELNRRNQKINPAATESNFAALSSSSRILDYARKLIAARTVIPVKSQKTEIIRKFVNRLLILDEEDRDKTDPEKLIDELNTSDIEQIGAYTTKWLEKRDGVRNRKEAEDPYDAKIRDSKAEFGRKRIAQEAKKLGLAALLCRLAVGSTNGAQFDQQLKRTISNQKKSSPNSIPVISGDIKRPDSQDLPIIIQLDSDKTDLKQWAANTNGIQEKFSGTLCQAFKIPTQAMRIGGIGIDTGIINLFVQPPYGQNVVDSLNGTAPDALARMNAVRKCCQDLNANVESMTLGEFGLKVEDKLMDPRWNKKYAWPDSPPEQGQYWKTPIDQGGKPYYCPSGWTRFGVKVAEDEKEFDSRWGNWYLAYHGTQDENASKILTSGLRVSTNGCFYGDGVPRVYVSPSIEYCAHPRYARPWKKASKNGKDRWYQLVFQCRVNPESVQKIGPETLIKNEYKATVKVDPNFDNNELEWIILGKNNEQFITKDIVCYGLLMRISNSDPVSLTPSAWWKQSYHSDIYKS
ncbi:unnamed protein product [Rotaria socialis]|uniref:Uncharacterized protein n=1 Tax=Rotaria socialis TaxID=392032 RepID=A0A818JA77_9BILA|nr:unnamed protein product [Rotaria socialis]CAF4635996.1 unnamed protein product [Rotaria socialis]